MSRICTICARGGSKGVKNKNIRGLAGKPLIAYTINQAQASHLFDVIALSSDSPEILEVGRQYGVDLLVKRPEELATDTAAKVPVIQHCVAEAERVTGKRFDIPISFESSKHASTESCFSVSLLQMTLMMVSIAATSDDGTLSSSFILVRCYLVF